MAIALDAVSHGSGASPLTISHTCSGVNRLLLVFNRGALPSSVTYNGVSLTKLVDTSSGSTRLTLWYLIQPDPGTHDLVITSGSNPLAVVISYTGAARAATNWVTNTGTSSGTTTLGISTTPSQDNCWIAMGVSTTAGNPGGIAGTTNQTTRDNTVSNLYGGDTNGAITPAGATNTTVTGDTNDYFGITLAFDPYIPFSLTQTDTITSSDTVALNRGFLLTALDTITSSDVVTMVRKVILTILDIFTSSDSTITATTWTNEDKHTTSWTNETKH